MDYTDFPPDTYYTNFTPDTFYTNPRLDNFYHHLYTNTKHTDHSYHN